MQTETTRVGLHGVKIGTSTFHLFLHKLQFLLGITDLLLKSLELSRGLLSVEIVFTLSEELLLSHGKKLLIAQTEGALNLGDLLP